MITRKEKRKHERETNYLFEILKIQKHFFKNLIHNLKNVVDPRHQSYISYGPEVILFTMILKNMTGLKSMRNMIESFNKDECIENIRKVLGLECLDELPHYDTINDFLSCLDVEELEKTRTYMIKELLKKSLLNRTELKGNTGGHH